MGNDRLARVCWKACNTQSASRIPLRSVPVQRWQRVSFWCTGRTFDTMMESRLCCAAFLPRLFSLQLRHSPSMIFRCQHFNSGFIGRELSILHPFLGQGKRLRSKKDKHRSFYPSRSIHAANPCHYLVV